MSEKLQNDASYVAIIEDFDDGLCRYGSYNKNGELILKTIGKIREVKKNPKYLPDKNGLK
jgi:hypothetical protein